MTKLLISFDDSDLMQIDGIVEQCGLPSRASAVRMAIRRWGVATPQGQWADPTAIPGVEKGLAVDPGPAEESIVPPGYRLLDDVARETGGRFVAMRQRAAKLKMTKLVDDKLYVSREFVDLVMQEKENPNYT